MKKITLSALSLVVAFAASTAFATDRFPAKEGKPYGGYHNRMFKETDTNNDGLISKKEWEAKGEDMFAKIDTDKDGKLSQTEMKAHHEKGRAMMKKRMEKYKPAAAADEDHRPVTPTGILRN